MRTQRAERQGNSGDAQADVVVVGAGHNGLVCAAYLARAGYDVRVVERRHVVGGAVCTEEVIPGHKIDTGSSCHIMIHLTPIVRELELEKFGLEYMDLDPFGWAPVPEASGGGSIAFYKDVERTCASIARISPKDAEAYRGFVRFWAQINEGVMNAFLSPPTPGKLAMAIARGQWNGPKGEAKVATPEALRRIFTSYGQLIAETFEHETVRAAILWLAAQSGPPPTQTGTGDFAGWHAMLHKSGAMHPRGGSGELTRALAECVASHGGQVRTSAPVSRILVENGRATGVELEGGERILARAVVSACHVVTTFAKLVGPDACPPDLLRRVNNLRIGNGFGMIVRCSTTELPRYEVAPDDPDAHVGMQLLAPSTDYLTRAYADFLGGRPSQDPAVLAMTFSKVDPTLAPAGRHTVYAWSQYFPYELADGERWKDIREREADRILGVLARWAPNMGHAVQERFIQTPLDIEERFGMLRGNVMHLEMELDQMFLWRPLPELSSYTTPIGSLFLTGASMHPGGGVMGASGYNAAKVVQKALGSRRRASS
jgi:phytoene desaturase